MQYLKLNTILTAVAILSFATLKAQNRVGINTTDPQTPLHVWDPGQVPSVLLTLGDDTEARLELGFDRMQTKTNASVLPLLLQYEGGKVGINANALHPPQAPLHVWDPGQVPSTLFILGDNTEARLEVGFDRLQTKTSTAALALRLQHEGGNVSIGPDFPQSKLHITGGEDASFSTDGYLMMGSNTGTNLILDDNEILARNDGMASHLFIQRDSGDVLLCALEQGAVGIGITNSANMPTGYLLAVDGKGIFEEIRIELSGDWPDYVFHEDYHRLTLPQLEEYLSIHRHLPGIPSAETIKTEGRDIGEIQRLLLEKVEELTLYIIDLQKDNRALEAEIDLLRAQMLNEKKPCNRHD